MNKGDRTLTVSRKWVLTGVSSAQASSDVTQVQTRAKNTIDGQLNFPDPSTGPKPEVLAQQFTSKIAVSLLPNLLPGTLDLP